MNKRHALGAVLLLLFSVLLAGWNLADEYSLLGSPLAFFCYGALWMAAPALCALVALLAANDTARKSAATLLAVQNAIFLLYALNGPSSEHGEGAQHMHVMIVPLVLILFTVTTLPVMYGIGILRDRRGAVQ